jgi:beta-lactamase superfamily II metal-dependent hydrolase
MLRIVFWDVQHGHAAYLKTPNQHIIFDLGTGSYGSSGNEFSPLSYLKNRYGVKQLDAVVITHPHSDHLFDIGNFNSLSPRVLSRPRHLTDKEVREGNAAEDEEYVNKYFEINNRYTAPVAPETDPFKKENNGGVEIQMFTPRQCARSNLNNHSIVTVVSYASSKIIIPGDNESPSWNELLDDTTFKSAIKGTDILLASHHGRESGYSAVLFEHFSPYLTIVSDGSETDTSATDRYSKKSRGWKVHKRNGASEERKCVTTRNDGVIVVEFGLNQENQPYMSVTID